uniref:Uncharacterized protein n=1 Tax=Anguilla anguilla TaxID=7936 RepID=A0A0E9PBY8_ANGAN
MYNAYWKEQNDRLYAQAVFKDNIAIVSELSAKAIIYFSFESLYL